MHTKRGSELTDVLVCPVCRGSVAPTSSMCLSCHLPIRDVVANQAIRGGRAPGIRQRGRRFWRRISGVLLYAAATWWCAVQLPTSLLFVVPAAVAGTWLHTVKVRPLLGLVAFVVIVGVLPLVFWPSMLTGLFSQVTGTE